MMISFFASNAIKVQTSEYLLSYDLSNNTLKNIIEIDAVICHKVSDKKQLQYTTPMGGVQGRYHTAAV